MYSEILFVIAAIVVPLLFSKRWLIIVLNLACSALAGIITWHVGLREDVDIPPIMLVFGIVGSTVAALVIALVMLKVKTWYMRRWKQNPSA
jgi:hypothetical protein